MGCLNLLSGLNHSSTRSELSIFSGYNGMLFALHLIWSIKLKSVVKYLFVSGNEKLLYGSTFVHPSIHSAGISTKQYFIIYFN